MSQGCSTCGGSSLPKGPTSAEIFVKNYENQVLTLSDGSKVVLKKVEQNAVKID